MQEIQIGRMILGPVGTNSYYVYRDGQKDTKDSSQERTPVVLIDPPDAGERIYDALRERGFFIERILLTHAHFDHIGGIAGILSRSDDKIPVAAPEAEKSLCEDPELNCSLSMGGHGVTVRPDIWLHDGETVEAAGVTLQVIATPGHTVGSCCFYIGEAGVLISGDTLFAGSVGRADLPTGSMSTLVRSIKEKLFDLPDETLVLPGHGEETTIGDEKRYNPFIQ
ncbi:MAG: MBL fold metallo-hydrolase [Lachnospiraceae bacterium]|nr:MBL fold metallo-hydrolase [Lachnospiraceae bacterium]